MQKTKQISYLSAVVILIGSVIGAGIFFKNGAIFANAGGSIGFLIASWVVAGIGVMAIGIALVEVSSGAKDNSGMLGWLRTFVGPKASKYGAGYMLLVSLPLNYVALPIYAVMSIQDASGAHLHGWIVALIAFGFFAWTACTSFISMKFGEISQWIYTVIKFIPLIVIVIISLIQTSKTGAVSQVIDDNGQNISASGLTGFSPWLGIFASIPAILFAVDGFYTVTGLKTNLKDEKKLGSIIALGVAIIIAVYLVFAIVTSIPGVGSFNDLTVLGGEWEWVKQAINYTIMFAVIGIVNGFALSVPAVYEDTEKDNKIGTVEMFKKIFKVKSDKNAAFYASTFVTVLMYLIIVPIGIYLVHSTPGEGTYTDYYSQSAANLYELTDMVTNFTSLLIFVIIGGGIAGALRNRKTNKVKVEKNKYFVVSAWIAIVFISLGTIYMIVETIVNMSGINGADSTTAIVEFSIMLLMFVISGIPIGIDLIKGRKSVATK